MARTNVVSGAGPAGFAPDPYHCPDCHTLLVDADGIGACPRCGFRSDHPLAARVWEIDIERVDLAREAADLGRERAQLMEQMRRDRAAAAETVALEHAAARPQRVRRAVSVQAVLVGLGAFLLVVAGVVFAAVTWDRLGAAGQAAVLAVATLTAAAVTLTASRRDLHVTAEALSVVTAGFAIVDVHAARVAVTPDGPWQPVWAVGLVVVALGLLALGRAGHLRAPALLAAVAAQPPLVLLASLADRPGPGAMALLVVAALDLTAAGRLRQSGVTAISDRLPALVSVLGAAAWTLGAAVSVPWALGATEPAVTAGERWWCIAVLAFATAEAVLLALRGPDRRLLPVLASVGSVLTGLTTVVAVVDGAGAGDEALRLFVTAAPAVVLAASLAVLRRPTAKNDVRLRMGQITAGVWAGCSLLPWVGPVLESLAAPFVVVLQDGWWTRGPGVTTGALDPLAELSTMVIAPPSTAALMAAVVAGTAALALGVLAIARPGRAAARGITAAVCGAGCFTLVAVAAVRFDVPVWALVAVDLAATAGLVLGPASWRSTSGRVRIWVLLGSLPVAASALAWAGSVDAFTVAALAVLAGIAAVATLRGITAGDHVRTDVATAWTGVALAAAAGAGASAAGTTGAQAWIAALAVASAVSWVAFVADARVPWWSSAVDVTSSAVVLGTLAGLIATGTPDTVTVGLAIVTVVAASHILRPSRRVVATVAAAVAGLCLLWLRLWVGDVRAVEAYSLPPATLLLAAGGWQMRRNPSLRSWPALGPGLLVAAVPSVVVAVQQTGVARPLIVLGVAVAVTIVGAALRMQAPLMVGAVSAAVIAVDQLFPVVEQFPRWVVIGTAGIVLLVVGATFEQRRRQAVHLYHRYRDLR